jgi:hypothetical protein
MHRHPQKIARMGILISLFIPSCFSKSNMKTVEFINASPDRVRIEVQGIQLYREGGGPQTFSGYPKPGGIQSMSAVTSTSPKIEYPVKILWKSDGQTNFQEKNFYGIGGLSPGQTKIYEGGTFVAGIDKESKPRLFFVRGIGVNSERHYELLDKYTK